jgi:Protein of unknown function (DUF550)
MPETLTIWSTVSLDTLRDTRILGTILKVMVEQMFEEAERRAAEDGRRMRPDAWRLSYQLIESNPMYDTSPQVMLKLKGEGHLIKVTEEHVLGQRWYAIPDTLIGGWAVATAPVEGTHVIDMANTDVRVMCETWGESTARHVADLHNAALEAADEPAALDASFLERLMTFSRRAFGPNVRTGGVLDHLRKELLEIEDAPHDLSEWVDVILLGLDGAWRHGGRPQEIIDAIVAKLAKNEARAWPDWRTLPEDRAIEHDRSAEQPGKMVRSNLMGPATNIPTGDRL